MDYKGLCWLWIVALCPCPGLQAGNLENLSQIEQIPARPEGSANSTLQENATDRPGVTEDGTDPLSQSWTATTSPAFPFLQNSTEYETDSPAARRGSSASFWIPPLVAVVLLIILFLMYRRKRGRESRSRMTSIIESSESDSENNLAVEQAVQLNPPTEIAEEALQTTEALSPAMDGEAKGPQAQPQT